MPTPSTCKHMEFAAAVRVARLEDTGRFVAEVSIHCRDCDVPMIFKGMQPGYNAEGATVSLDGKTAFLGIVPLGDGPDPLQILLGITPEKFN